MTIALLLYSLLFLVAYPGTSAKRALNILFLFDCLLFSVCTLGQSYPFESFSSAAWRSQGCGGLYGRLFKPAIDWVFLVFFNQHEHCANAYFRAKLNLPEDQR